MANAYFYSNIATPTTLSGNINNSALSCTVLSTTGWPTSYPFIIALDFGAANEELVQVTNNSAGTLTIVRAFGGTSAVSHSTGAVVRHVFNAVDATDFRTHEAATTNVHGTTGALVGTTNTQTLTNKTISAGTYSGGGSFAGTFTGTPTFSGAVTLSGGGALSGTFTGTPTLSGAVVLSGTPNISAGAALAGTLSGTPDFSGNFTVSGTPTFNGQALAKRASASLPTWRSSVNGDSNDRFYVQADGGLQWGSGSGAVDTNLYRSAANTLTTDDVFNAGGGLTVGTTSWTAFNPTVTGGGAVVFSTKTGYYYKIGKLVFVNGFMQVGTAGTGTANVSIDMPSNIDRSTRQVIGCNSDNLGLNGHSHLVSFTGGTGATFDRVRSYDGQNMVGSDFLVNGLLTFQGWYREA